MRDSSARGSPQIQHFRTRFDVNVLNTPNHSSSDLRTIRVPNSIFYLFSGIFILNMKNLSNERKKKQIINLNRNSFFVVYTLSWAKALCT